MAKPLHALATATVLAGATFAAQTASADLLYSFEDGTVQGFNIRGSDATMLSIDAPGATDGMLALQVDRPSGGFDNDLRVTATQFLPQLAAADALAFDLTVLNNAGNPTFTQFGLEINAGEGFVNLPFQPVSNDPTSGPQTLQFDLSSANIDGDEDFITIFFRRPGTTARTSTSRSTTCERSSPSRRPA